MKDICERIGSYNVVQHNYEKLFKILEQYRQWAINEKMPTHQERMDLEESFLKIKYYEGFSDNQLRVIFEYALLAMRDIDMDAKVTDNHHWLNTNELNIIYNELLEIFNEDEEKDEE